MAIAVVECTGCKSAVAAARQGRPGGGRRGPLRIPEE